MLESAKSIEKLCDVYNLNFIYFIFLHSTGACLSRPETDRDRDFVCFHLFRS